MSDEKYADIVNYIYKSIHKNYILCFCAGIVSGLLTHLYMMTNKLPIWDDVFMFDTNGLGSLIGRWLLAHIDWLSGDYSSSWINSFLLIIFLSIASCFIVATLELKSKTSAILVPILIMTFPSTTSTICHMYTADSFAFAIMLVCISAFLWRRYKYGFIFAMVPLVLSLGCYQAYLCLEATIIVASLLLDVFRTSEDNSKTVFICGVKGLITLSCGSYIYVAISHLVYPGLGDYAGVNDMGKIDIRTLPYNIAIAYKRLLDYFIIKPKSFVNSEMRLFNIMSALILAGVISFFFIKKKIYKSLKKSILAIFLIIVFPMAMSAIYIIASKANFSTIMLMPYTFVYIFTIAVMELYRKEIILDVRKQIMRNIMVCIILFVMLGVVHSNFVLTNQAYLRMDVAYKRVAALYNRIGTRVEGLEGFNSGDRFTVIGDFYTPGIYNGNLLSDEYRMDDDRYLDFSGIALENGLMTNGTRGYFCKIYLGLPYEIIDDEAREKIEDTEEYKSMTIYPSEGSIKKIGDLWIVKYPER